MNGVNDTVARVTNDVRNWRDVLEAIGADGGLICGTYGFRGLSSNQENEMRDFIEQFANNIEDVLSLSEGLGKECEEKARKLSDDVIELRQELNTKNSLLDHFKSQLEEARNRVRFWRDKFDRLQLEASGFPQDGRVVADCGVEKVDAAVEASPVTVELRDDGLGKAWAESKQKNTGDCVSHGPVKDGSYFAKGLMIYYPNGRTTVKIYGKDTLRDNWRIAREIVEGIRSSLWARDWNDAQNFISDLNRLYIVSNPPWKLVVLNYDVDK